MICKLVESGHLGAINERVGVCMEVGTRHFGFVRELSLEQGMRWRSHDRLAYEEVALYVNSKS